MTSEHDHNKAAIHPLRAAMYDWSSAGVRDALAAVIAPGATVRLAFPFEDLDGHGELWGSALSPLADAMPDIERRDTIVIAGPDPHGANWVGCGGYYTGTWIEPFLRRACGSMSSTDSSRAGSSRCRRSGTSRR